MLMFVNKSLFLYCLFLVIISNYCISQEDHYTHQITFSTDNDVFTFDNGSDRYYSFGGGLKYTFTAKRFLGLQHLFKNKDNVFYDVEYRIEGYTPSDVNDFALTERIEGPDEFDRPYAGLSYFTLGASYIFKRSFFKTELLVGVLGPSSQADEVQSWFHRNIIDEPIYDGWKFQLEDQFLLNINSYYTHDFNPNHNWFNTFGTANLKLGNLFNQASAGLGFRIGKFAKISKSSSFNNSILLPKKNFEFFFQFSSSGSINISDATIQGNIFDRGKYSFSDLNNVSWNIKNGLYFSKNRFSCNISYSWSSGVLDTTENHIFGTISGSYRF